MTTRGIATRSPESHGRIVTENPALLALLTRDSTQEKLASSPPIKQYLSGPSTNVVSDTPSSGFTHKHIHSFHANTNPLPSAPLSDLDTGRADSNLNPSVISPHALPRTRSVQDKSVQFANQHTTSSGDLTSIPRQFGLKETGKSESVHDSEQRSQTSITPSGDLGSGGVHNSGVHGLSLFQSVSGFRTPSDTPLHSGRHTFRVEKPTVEKLPYIDSNHNFRGPSGSGADPGDSIGSYGYDQPSGDQHGDVYQPQPSSRSGSQPRSRQSNPYAEDRQPQPRSRQSNPYVEDQQPQPRSRQSNPYTDDRRSQPGSRQSQRDHQDHPPQSSSRLSNQYGEGYRSQPRSRQSGDLNYPTADPRQPTPQRDLSQTSLGEPRRSTSNVYAIANPDILRAQGITPPTDSVQFTPRSRKSSELDLNKSQNAQGTNDETGEVTGAGYTSSRQGQSRENPDSDRYSLHSAPKSHKSGSYHESDLTAPFVVQRESESVTPKEYRQRQPTPFPRDSPQRTPQPPPDSEDRPPSADWGTPKGTPRQESEETLKGSPRESPRQGDITAPTDFQGEELRTPTPGPAYLKDEGHYSQPDMTDPDPVKRVYVDSPGFTKEEEDEYRFVSSRLDDHDLEDTYRQLEKTKPAPAEPDMDRYEDRNERTDRADAGHSGRERGVDMDRYEDRNRQSDLDLYQARDKPNTSGSDKFQERNKDYDRYEDNRYEDRNVQMQQDRHPSPKKSEPHIASDPPIDPKDAEELKREYEYQEDLKYRIDQRGRHAEELQLPKVDDEGFARDSLDYQGQETYRPNEGFARDSLEYDGYGQSNRDANYRGGVRDTEWKNPPPPPFGQAPPPRQDYQDRRGPPPGFSDDSREESYEQSPDYGYPRHRYNDPYQRQADGYSHGQQYYDGRVEAYDGRQYGQQYQTRPHYVNELDSARMEVVHPLVPKYDYVENNKMDYGKPQPKKYQDINERKREEEEKLDKIFIHPKVKPKPKKKRSSAPPHQGGPAFAQPHHQFPPGHKPNSAEEMWAMRAAGLQKKKDSKVGSGKNAKLQKFPSDSGPLTRYQYRSPEASPPKMHYNDQLDHRQPPRPAPEPSGEPNMAVNITAQSPWQQRKPLDLQPITQEIVTEDGQRISVDINLKLMSPPPLAGSQGILGTGRPAQHSGSTSHPDSQASQGSQLALRQVGVPYNMQYSRDQYQASRPSPSHQQQDDYENYPPPASQSPRDLIAEQIAAEEAALRDGTFSPYSKIPPISTASDDQESSTSTKEVPPGGYALMYKHQKTKDPNEKPWYKVYTVTDYKKMQRELDIKRGPLGADLDNETYKEKLEKRHKQFEYARNVMEKNKHEAETKPRPSPKKEEPPENFKRKQAPSSKAIDYARTVPKPSVKPQTTQYNSYEVASQLSPVSKRSSAASKGSGKQTIDVINLQKLQQRHEQEKKNVAMIRQRQNMESVLTQKA